MEHINYLVILMAALVAVASPGPATLAITSVAINQGRAHGIMLAIGIWCGSLFWSCTAAFGLGAVMSANIWLFEILRYAGAGYLLFLAYKAAFSAVRGKTLQTANIATASLPKSYLKGLAIHLTNPKAILFFSALYAIGVPHHIGVAGLLKVIAVVALQSGVIFVGYALLFSTQKARAMYLKLNRAFDIVFGTFFGIAGVKVLMSRLNN